MKQVFVIIRPNMYYKTKDALVKNNFHSMSVKEVLGRGKEGAKFTTGNGEEVINVDTYPFVAKKMIEIFCRDEDLEQLVEAVKKVNQTGHAGDGKIFVLEAEDIVRIRTGEKGVDALM